MFHGDDVHDVHHVIREHRHVVMWLRDSFSFFFIPPQAEPFLIISLLAIPALLRVVWLRYYLQPLV